jgi:hypothetical protein
MEPHEILPEPIESGKESIIDAGDSGSEMIGTKNIENKQSSAGYSPQGSTALSGVALDDAQGVVAQYQGQITSDLGSTASSGISIMVPDSAEDLDLIEKIWVQKAKQIVESTQGNPHVQNKQLNKMKVEYIKKRYDKDIKFSEET